jgi:hypothetical protein
VTRPMEYKSHPYFDESDSADWHECPLDPNRRFDPAGIDHPLGHVIRRDFDQIKSLGLESIRRCVPADWLAECPHAMLNDFAFAPMADDGIRVYLEYAFMPSLTEASYHTDTWWAIVQNPYTSGCPHTGKIEYRAAHVGWNIQ